MLSYLKISWKSRRTEFFSPAVILTADCLPWKREISRDVTWWILSIKAWKVDESIAPFAIFLSVKMELKSTFI